MIMVLYFLFVQSFCYFIHYLYLFLQKALTFLYKLKQNVEQNFLQEYVDLILHHVMEKNMFECYN